MKFPEHLEVFNRAVASSHVRAVCSRFDGRDIAEDMLRDMLTKGRQAIRDVLAWQGDVETGLELARYTVLARHRQEPNRLALALSFQFTENGDTPCGTWEIAVN
jgi:hypothetical protein